uniref:beta-ketoacyl synthase N-terminal-like domain-containing protein n=1 Tax=uncultured Bilophila sp. TaxID=529385 RepID=UPI00260B782E
MSRKRVVVTGVSALTPLGGNVSDSWDNLLAGKSGIGPITLFDAAGFDSRIAGEVKGFDPEAYGIPAKQARRMDRFVQFSVAAGNMLVKDSGLVIDESNAARVSVILGVGLGGLHTIEVFHSRLVEAGPNKVSPFMIPMLISNMAPGQVAIATGAKGANMVLTSACASGTHAVGMGFTEIVMGRCDACITGGVEAMPEGWSSTSGATYANSAYSGESVPSLRLGGSSDYLTTPLYADGVKTLSFWHRGNSVPDTDRIRVSALVDDKWIVVAELPIVNEKGGATCTLADEIPEGAVQLRISYSMTSGRGAVAVDDVVVGHGTTFSNVPVPGLTAYPAGSGTSCAIDGLKAETEYYYTVAAVGADDTLSLPSQEVAVTTAEDPNSSGVADVAVDAADAPAEYYNLQGIRVETPVSGTLYIRRQGGSS